MASQATSKPGSGTSQSFEATALRVSAIPARAAILRSLFEAKDYLWLAADKMRNNMDATQYKHVVSDTITTDTFKTLDYVFPPPEITKRV